MQKKLPRSLMEGSPELPGLMRRSWRNFFLRWSAVIKTSPGMVVASPHHPNIDTFRGRLVRPCPQWATLCRMEISVGNDMVASARKKRSAKASSLSGTGGGLPVVIELSSLEERALALVGDHPHATIKSAADPMREHDVIRTAPSNAPHPSLAHEGSV